MNVYSSLGHIAWASDFYIGALPLEPQPSLLYFTFHVGSHTSETSLRMHPSNWDYWCEPPHQLDFEIGSSYFFAWAGLEP
jgi:hypothetical protein